MTAQQARRVKRYTLSVKKGLVDRALQQQDWLGFAEAHDVPLATARAWIRKAVNNGIVFVPIVRKVD